MLLIREVYIAKPGHAGPLAKMFKAMMTEPDASGQLPVILLDHVTDYNTIVCQYYVKSLTDFEKMWESEKAKAKNQKPAKKDTGPKYTDMYLTGRREILRVVE